MAGSAPWSWFGVSFRWDTAERGPVSSISKEVAQYVVIGRIDGGEGAGRSRVVLLSGGASSTSGTERMVGALSGTCRAGL